MNNNFNQMGQFGGWTPSPYGYGSGMYNEQYLRYLQKKQEIKNVKKIGMWCGLAVISYIVISYAISLMIVFISWIFPSISKIYNETMPSLAFDIAVTFLAIGVPFFLVHLILKKAKLSTDLPFGKAKDTKQATYLVMMFLPIMVVGAIAINYISAIFQSLIGIEFTAAVNEIKLVGTKETILGVISVAIVPALLEEIVIRGILLQPLRKYGDKFAIVTSALVFACMHGNMVQIPYTVIGGLLMGYLAVVTGSLWPSIILHFLNNFYSVIAITTSDNFGDVVSTATVLIMVVLFAIIGVIAAIKYSKMKYNTVLSEGDSILITKEKVIAFVVNPATIIAIIILIIVTLSNIKV